MDQLRKIIDNASNPLSIDLPKKYENRKLEVIVLLLDENTEATKKYDFTDVFGQLEWRGDPLAEQKRVRD